MWRRGKDEEGRRRGKGGEELQGRRSVHETIMRSNFNVLIQFEL